MDSSEPVSSSTVVVRYESLTVSRKDRGQEREPPITIPYIVPLVVAAGCCFAHCCTTQSEMNSFRVSTSLLSRNLVANRGRGLALLSMVSTLPSIALCEKASPALFSKDSQGNIDWGKTLSRVPESAFWDDVAKVAGVKVRLGTIAFS